MSDVVEFVGGPRDGEVEYYPVLPRQVIHVVRPADYYERVFAATFDKNNIPDRPLWLEGLYTFDRITWTFPYWDADEHPVTAAYYEWQGYQ